MDLTDIKQLAGSFPVNNTKWPDDDGPRGITYLAPLRANVDYLIDLTLSNARNIIENIQTLWVDNRAGANALTISCLGSQQVLTIAPGDARFVSCLAPLAQFVLNRADAGNALIIFINVPIPTDIGSLDFANVLAELVVIANEIGALTSSKETNPDAASANLNALLRGILYQLQQSETTIASAISYLASSAASTNATNVKASAAKLKSIQGYNASASVRYLQLYNNTNNPPVPGTDTPLKILALPPLAAFVFDFDFAFSVGLGFALVTTGATNASGAVSAGDILALNIDYI